MPGVAYGNTYIRANYLETYIPRTAVQWGYMALVKYSL